MAVGENFRSSNTIQGQPTGLVSQTVTLTANNTVLNPSSPLLAMVNLESDNNTAANRVFTLVGGQVDGQMLRVVFTGSSNKAKLVNSGNVIIGADWIPTAQGDQIELIWNARAAKWVKIASVAT